MVHFRTSAGLGLIVTICCVFLLPLLSLFCVCRFFLCSFYTKYDSTHFLINFASLVVSLLPKLPQFHRVRLFGINRYWTPDPPTLLDRKKGRLIYSLGKDWTLNISLGICDRLDLFLNRLDTQRHNNSLSLSWYSKGHASWASIHLLLESKGKVKMVILKIAIAPWGPLF